MWYLVPIWSLFRTKSINWRKIWVPHLCDASLVSDMSEKRFLILKGVPKSPLHPQSINKVKILPFKLRVDRFQRIAKGTVLLKQSPPISWKDISATNVVPIWQLFERYVRLILQDNAVPSRFRVGSQVLQEILAEYQHPPNNHLQLRSLLAVFNTKYTYVFFFL